MRVVANLKLFSLFAVATSVLLLGCEGEGEDDERGEGVAEVEVSECSSGLKWVGGDEESSQMHPGLDCIGCHDREGEGPDYEIAGTVFSALHEADDCFGIEGVLVEITDDRGAVFQTTTNRAGSFTLRDAFTGPLTARIAYQGREAQMILMQSSGRCATCHTVQGASGAPGRIVAP